MLMIAASCAEVAHARSRPARQREHKRVDPGIMILREERAATDRDDCPSTSESVCPRVAHRRGNAKQTRQSPLPQADRLSVLDRAPFAQHRVVKPLSFLSALKLVYRRAGGVRVLAFHLGRIDRRPRGGPSLRFELLGLTSFGFPVARPPAGVLDACGLRLQLLPQLVAELILNILSMVRPAVRQVNTLRSLLREYCPAALALDWARGWNRALIAVGLPL